MYISSYYEARSTMSELCQKVMKMEKPSCVRPVSMLYFTRPKGDGRRVRDVHRAQSDRAPRKAQLMKGA